MPPDSPDHPERANRQIKWKHKGDECVARVGQKLRWRSPIPNRDRFGIWQYGATVIGIDPSGRVFLAPGEPLFGWNPVIECGDSFSIEDDD